MSNHAYNSVIVHNCIDNVVYIRVDNELTVSGCVYLIIYAIVYIEFGLNLYLVIF